MGHSYGQAIGGIAANHVYGFDKGWLDYCDTAVLVLPAGKSGHMEFGYMVGRGKQCHVLFESEPSRYDVMYLLAEGVNFSVDELIERLAA